MVRDECSIARATDASSSANLHEIVASYANVTESVVCYCSVSGNVGAYE